MMFSIFFYLLIYFSCIFNNVSPFLLLGYIFLLSFQVLHVLYHLCDSPYSWQYSLSKERYFTFQEKASLSVSIFSLSLIVLLGSYSRFFSNPREWKISPRFSYWGFVAWDFTFSSIIYLKLIFYVVWRIDQVGILFLFFVLLLFWLLYMVSQLFQHH